MNTLQDRALRSERLRISRDIHDNLGSRLTEIILLSDLAQSDRIKPGDLKQHVGRLSNVAREAVRDLRSILWAVNPKNDYLDNFADYLFQYVENFLGATSIRFRVDIDEDLPHRALSSEARSNLFLVCKEALNNIVKHSEATDVLVRVTAADGQLHFLISDNGKGFARGRAGSHGGGNGLGNMENRIHEAGGEFDLESAPGEGTRIKIAVPLVRARRSNRVRAIAN